MTASVADIAPPFPDAAVFLNMIEPEGFVALSLGPLFP